MAALATLIDLFDQGSLNAGLWTQFTAGGATFTYAASGAQVNYPASSTSSTDGDLSSNTSYDLTGSAAYLQTIATPSSATSADAELRIFTDASNWFRFVLEGGTLFCQRKKAGTQATVVSFAFNATTHKWWKISESGGTVTWSTSTDGINYTSRGTFVHGMTITAMKVLIAATCFQAESNPGTFKWNNFNTTGSTPTPAFLSRWMMTGMGN